MDLGLLIVRSEVRKRGMGPSASSIWAISEAMSIVNEVMLLLTYNPTHNLLTKSPDSCLSKCYPVSGHGTTISPKGL